MFARPSIASPTRSKPSLTPARNVLLQRKCACGGTPGPSGECEACRKKRLQRKSTDAAGEAQHDSVVPPIVHDVLRSPGQPLDRETRAFVEPRFGHDFSGVRVHTDTRAAESARAVDALAYTVGNDVVLGTGKYALDTTQGKQLLAHELTHVVQQSGINSNPANLIIGESDSIYEREAEAKNDLLTNRAGEHQPIPVMQRVSRPVVMRRQLFSSTLKICHRLLKSREFAVSQGGLRVGIDARWQGPSEGAASCESHRRSPYNVVLTQRNLIVDREYGNCQFDPQKPSSRQWIGVPPDDYYLTIWTNNTNPNCCLEGEIEVSEQAGLTGESCTEIPDDALTILHSALDVAGLIPALGAIPDGINAAIYAIEGDWVSAGISAAAMIPIFGEGVTITKLGVKVTRSAVKRVGKEAIEVGLKEAKTAGKKILGKEARKAEKELLTEGAEAATRKRVGESTAKTAEKGAEEATEKVEKEAVEDAAKREEKKAIEDANKPKEREKKPEEKKSKDKKHEEDRPGTKCTETEHAKYYGAVKFACNGFSCEGTDTIEEMLAKSALAHACATARFTYQRKCFARGHPDWVGHEEQRVQAEKAARRCLDIAKKAERKK
jgi:hypothetical protein